MANEVINQLKFSGIIIDEKLSWGEHITYIKSPQHILSHQSREELMKWRVILTTLCEKLRTKTFNLEIDESTLHKRFFNLQCCRNMFQ